MIYPANCAGNGNGGSADMKTVFRYSVNSGETLSATFCAEGSTILVTVGEGTSSTTIFRCYRYTSNANICQRIS